MRGGVRLTGVALLLGRTAGWGSARGAALAAPLGRTSFSDALLGADVRPAQVALRRALPLRSEFVHVVGVDAGQAHGQAPLVARTDPAAGLVLPAEAPQLAGGADVARTVDVVGALDPRQGAGALVRALPLCPAGARTPMVALLHEYLPRRSVAGRPLRGRPERSDL